MIFSERQKEIIEIARVSGRVLVDDLARRFSVSAQTVRKDLNDICERRALTRIHGGAIVASGVENVAYGARRFVAAAEKRSIAAAAAAIIPDSSSLFINIGTTTEEVAHSLKNRQQLLVITNNLNVAMQLYPMPSIEVIVAGGSVRRSDGAVFGALSVSLISQFKVDYAIIGISAIDQDGTLLDFDYSEVQASQAIMENARHVILVADSTKFRRSAPVRLGSITSIDTFITDSPLPESVAAVCNNSGCRVLIAPPAESSDESLRIVSSQE